MDPAQLLCRLKILGTHRPGQERVGVYKAGGEVLVAREVNDLERWKFLP